MLAEEAKFHTTGIAGLSGESTRIEWMVQAFDWLASVN